VRTTVTIDDHLLEEAKVLAARSHRPLGAVIEDGLRVLLGGDASRAQRHPLRLPTYGGTGLQPGVDLENKDALAELLDEEPPSAAR
jgi:hypothetical protein